MTKSLDVFAAAKCLAVLWQNPSLRRATYYSSPSVVVKATRQFPHAGRVRHETFIVTIGRPNHRESRFIALCKKIGEKFPVKKIQLTSWPKRKRRKLL